MKKSLLLASLLLLSILATAQTQKGFVKTLGRPEKKGEALSGVTIRVKGQHNPVISQDDGTFSISMDDKKNGDPYSLQQVQKKGYELNESGLIGRQQTFSSKVPLTIVMASTAQLSADKERIEEQAQKTASKNYEERIAQLEQQLADNEISAEQYQAAIADLLDKFEKYQQLIDGLAEHYAHTDYDLLNETEREINLCIENGDLNRADSLIQTLFDPIDVIKRNKEALASIDQQIAQAQSILDQAYEDMAAVLRQQEKDAEHLYQLYTIAAARFDNDKALFYIETRAELDTTRWEWQFEAGGYCFNQNLIEKAEVYYERVLDILEETMIDFYENTPDISVADSSEIVQNLSFLVMFYTTQTNLATLYQKTQRIAESEKLYLESIEYFKDFAQVSPEDEMLRIPFLGITLSSTMMGLSELYRMSGRISESEALSQEALNIVRQIKPDGANDELVDIKLAQILMSRGLMYKDQQQYEESEACYLEALAVHRRIAETNTDNETEVARTLHNLANLYADMKRYEDSEAAYLEGLEIYRRRAKANPQAYEIKVGMIASSLANLYTNMKRYEESEALFEEALEIKRRWATMMPEVFEPELALTLGNFSVLYQKTKQYEKCEPLLLESHEIYQRLARLVPEKYGAKLAITKYNLASLYYMSDKIKESLPFWVESLSMFQELSQRDSKQYKSNLNDIVDFVEQLAPWVSGEASDLYDEKQYEEAEFYYINALEMFKLLAQTDPETYEPEIGITLNDLGILYNNTKRYEECEATYQECLEIRRRLAKKDPSREYQLAYTLNNIAYMYLLTERYQESETYYLEALEIFRRITQDNLLKFGPIMCKTLSNFGTVYKNTQRNAEYEATFLELVEIRKKLAQADPKQYEYQLCFDLNDLGVMHFNANRYKESEVAYLEALEIRRRLAETDPQYEIYVANTLNNLGWLYYCSERYQESVTYYLESTELYKKQIRQNPDDSTIQKRYENTFSNLSSAYAKAKEVGAIPEERKADVESIKQLLNE